MADPLPPWRAEEREPEARAKALERVALGSDPFASPDGPDPFLEGLAALQESALHLPAPRASAPLVEAPTVSLPEVEEPASPARLLPRRRRWAAVPRVDEVEAPKLPRWIESLTRLEDRRRLAAVAHLVEGDSSYDRFGLSPEILQRAFPFLYGLYRAYFRVKSEGHEHLPVEGPAILAGNHGGLLPFDASMVIMDAFLNTDPPRLARAVVDRWAGSIPWVNIFYARVGQVIGTRENFSDLLADGQLMLVFPEGMDGACKPITQRYRLQSFRVGFVEQALRAGAPIVPVAVIGSDDQAPVLFDLKPLAKQFGLPVLPITPTFPLLGPLGLLPYPVGYKIVYGEPLRFQERFGPDDADDSRLVRALAKQVRYRVQQLVDRNR